jgi:hypothetical protein
MTLATVLIDPPTTLFAGGILALISWKLVKVDLAEVWRVGQLSAAWGLAYGIGVGWWFFFRPDWMFVYTTDTSKLPLVPLYLLFLFICALWGGLGGLGVGLLVHLKKPALAVTAFASAILGWALFLFMTLDQYTHVGTRSEYLAGTAKALADDANWLMASNVSAVVCGIPAIGIIVLQVRRMRAP